MNQLVIGSINLSQYKPFCYINGGGSHAWVEARVRDVPIAIIRQLTVFENSGIYLPIYATTPQYYNDAYLYIPLYDWSSNRFQNGKICGYTFRFWIANNRYGANMELRFETENLLAKGLEEL